MKYGILAAGTLFVATATAASAGGYIPPQADTAIVAPVAVVAPMVGNWEGGYAGLSLGYAFGGSDELNLNDSPTYGKLKMDGVNGEARIGYRWQRDRWVFGPELSYMGGDIKDSIDIYDEALVGAGNVAALESSVRGVAALKMKAGYEVQPNMLVYGTLGVAQGDFKYEFLDAETKYSAAGAVFGVGVERMVTDRMSVTAEIERNQFKKKDILVSGIGDTEYVTQARPSFNNIKVGLNFRF